MACLLCRATTWVWPAWASASAAAIDPVFAAVKQLSCHAFITSCWQHPFCPAAQQTWWLGGADHCHLYAASVCRQSRATAGLHRGGSLSTQGAEVQLPTPCQYLSCCYAVMLSCPMMANMTGACAPCDAQAKPPLCLNQQDTQVVANLKLRNVCAPVDLQVPEAVTSALQRADGRGSSGGSTDKLCRGATRGGMATSSLSGGSSWLREA